MIPLTGIYASSFVAIASVVVGALLTAAMQDRLLRKQIKLALEEDRRKEKQRIVSQLIAYRFVLTGASKDAAAASAFNAALSSIPVFFAEHKSCIDQYRTFGDNFTSERFYLLIVELMNAASLSKHYIDKHLLENVPSVPNNKRD